MAVNPLEGLMSVAANHQLVSGSTAEPQRQQHCAAGSPASLHGHRQSTRSSRDPRKWVSLKVKLLRVILVSKADLAIKNVEKPVGYYRIS